MIIVLEYKDSIFLVKFIIHNSLIIVFHHIDNNDNAKKDKRVANLATI